MDGELRKLNSKKAVWLKNGQEIRIDISLLKCVSGQHVQEKTCGIINHLGIENQEHNEITLYTHLGGYDAKGNKSDTER